MHGTVDEKKSDEMIGFMTEEKAAKIIVQGLENNKAIIAFPNNVYSMVFVMGTVHPILNVLLNKFFGVDRSQAAQCVGFYHEFDPDDEFGGEC